MKPKLQIFLSYAIPDAVKTEECYQKLAGAGFNPWMDRRDLVAGEDWEVGIENAIRKSHIFLLLLSKNSTTRSGVLQKEIKHVLEKWEENSESDIYFIPARLEQCEVPERLHGFQWIDLFEKNGWSELFQTISSLIEKLSSFSISRDAEEPSKISITLNIEGYSEAYKRLLTHSLASFLNIAPGDIRIVRVEKEGDK